MHTNTRLLLPFTGEIDTLAITYALQLANKSHATLVALALVEKEARLEYLQQAQDFLEFTRYKARQQHVPIERVRRYTSNSANSIEAIAREGPCEAVIIFVNERHEALLRHEEIRALMEYATCNLHIVLLPDTWKRHQPLHMPLSRRLPDDDAEVSRANASVEGLLRERMSRVSLFSEENSCSECRFRPV